MPLSLVSMLRQYVWNSSNEELIFDITRCHGKPFHPRKVREASNLRQFHTVALSNRTLLRSSFNPQSLYPLRGSQTQIVVDLKERNYGTISDIQSPEITS